MVAPEASDHNFFRRLICPRATLVRIYSSPITEAATSSPPHSTSSHSPASPVSARGDGPPEALTRASASRHNSSRRGPRLPCCARNSAPRPHAWPGSRRTGGRTTRPPSGWPSWNSRRYTGGRPAATLGRRRDRDHLPSTGTHLAGSNLHSRRDGQIDDLSGVETG